MNTLKKKIAALAASLVAASSVSVPLFSAGASVGDLGTALGDTLNFILTDDERPEWDTSTTTSSGAEAPETEYSYAEPQIAVLEINDEVYLGDQQILSSESYVSIGDITEQYYVGDIFALDVETSGCSYVEYTSSDEDIASIDSDGTVTLLAAGEVTFTVYGYGGGSVVEDSLTYTVEEEPNDNYRFVVDKTYDGETIYIFGSSETFTIESYPLGAYGVPTSWESSNPDVARVDKDGQVTVYCDSKYYEQDFTITITARNEYWSDSITFYVCVGKLITSTTTTLTTTTTTTICYGFDLDKTHDGETIYIFGSSESFIIESDPHYDSSYGVPTRWESSNPDVANVDENGKVTVYCDSKYYVQEFTITITASNDYWWDSITFYVCVGQLETTTIQPAYISLSEPDKSDIYFGNSFSLDYYGYGYSTIQWQSSDESVATVDQSGYVTIVGAGEVTIEVWVGGSINSEEDSVTFTVEPPPELELIEPDASQLYALNVFNIDYTGENINSIKWSTSDEAIAMILSDNRVKIIGYGTVTITATAKNSQGSSTRDSVTFTISESVTPSVTPSILPTKLTLAPGDTALLTVLNVPDGTTVTWLTDNTKVASVDNGNVTAVGEGTAVIYAVAGDTVCECTVTVVKSGTGVFGDADGDSELTITDVVVIMVHVVTPGGTLTAEQIGNADVYQRGDGISNMDALAVQKRIAQLLTSLPESVL